MSKTVTVSFGGSGVTQDGITLKDVIRYTPDGNAMPVVGIYISMSYSPTEEEKGKYSAFNWVHTITSNVFERSAAGKSPHNQPYGDSRPNYSYDTTTQFGFNALVDYPARGTPQNVWYQAELSAVGYADGRWYSLANVSFGWTYMGGILETYYNPSPNMSSWHIDSITNPNKW